jgi:hypothetical protein
MAERSTQLIQGHATALAWPTCAQCARPMKMERMEPGMLSGNIAFLRCESCRLKDVVRVGAETPLVTADRALAPSPHA